MASSATPETAKAKVVPIYFVPDESGSMASVVEELNQGLRALLDAMHQETMTAAMVRFSIIGFSDDIYEHLRLADLGKLETMPTLGAHAQTSYVSIFEDLRRRIDEDVNHLRSEGYLVFRPAVFFLTDGVPNPAGQPWERALGELVGEGFKYRPNILAFGVGDAAPEVIRRVASRKEYAFIAAKGVDTGTAIAKFSRELTRTIMVTAGRMASGNPEIPMQKPEGFTYVFEVLPE